MSMWTFVALLGVAALGVTVSAESCAVSGSELEMQERLEDASHESKLLQIATAAASPTSSTVSEASCSLDCQNSTCLAGNPINNGTELVEGFCTHRCSHFYDNTPGQARVRYCGTGSAYEDDALYGVSVDCTGCKAFERFLAAATTPVTDFQIAEPTASTAAEPTVSEASCPSDCRNPPCYSGNSENDGELLVDGVCTHRCSRLYNNATGEAVVRYCGTGSLYEDDPINGVSVDCTGCKAAPTTPEPTPETTPEATVSNLTTVFITSAVEGDNKSNSMLSFKYSDGVPNSKIFDGDGSTTIAGSGEQHDDVIAVELSAECSVSAFTVLGKDEQVETSDLRHVRVAYSLDGKSWKCYTQSHTPPQEDTPSLSNADTNCNEGLTHMPNGSTFIINGLAKFVEFAFWGKTSIMEVKLEGCTTHATQTTPEPTPAPTAPEPTPEPTASTPEPTSEPTTAMWSTETETVQVDIDTDGDGLGEVRITGVQADVENAVGEMRERQLLEPATAL